MKLTTIGFWGGYPKVNGASSGYLLEQDGFRLAIDFGSGVLSKMQNFIQPDELDAVIISHYHSDHIADIGVLQHARLVQGYLGKDMDPLPIYGHRLDEEAFARLSYKNITFGVEYSGDNPIQIGPFKVEFRRTKHSAPCFAMRFTSGGKSFVFTGDTAYTEELIPLAEDADVLLCECNFYGSQCGEDAGHMNSFDAGTLAEKARVKSLILTHLPHFGDHSLLLNEVAQKYAGPVKLAAYGQITSI